MYVHMCHHMFKIYVQASLLRGLTPFIISPCEIYNQNINLSWSHCVENIVVSYINSAEDPVCVVTNQSAW